MASNLEPKINRIATAVTSALSALTAKGVTVPEGANVESLAALIESIEAGGGGLQNNRLVNVASGSFTVVERTAMDNDNRFILQHDIGVIPLLIYIQASGSSASGDFTNGVFWRIKNSIKPSSSLLSSFVARRASSSSYRYVDKKNEVGTISGDDWTTDHVNLVCSNITVYFNSGITYKWYAYSAE